MCACKLLDNRSYLAGMWGLGRNSEISSIKKRIVNNLEHFFWRLKVGKSFRGLELRCGATSKFLCRSDLTASNVLALIYTGASFQLVNSFGVRSERRLERQASVRKGGLFIFRSKIGRPTESRLPNWKISIELQTTSYESPCCFLPILKKRLIPWEVVSRLNDNQ